MSNFLIDRVPMDVSGSEGVVPEGYFSEVIPEVKGIPIFPNRIARLITCRESNEYDQVLMEGMIQQTLFNVPTSPSIERAKALGIQPLIDDDNARLDYPRIILRHGKAKGVLFELDGDYFLYSMSSAARTTKTGDNDWTSMCARVIEHARPKEIYVASISRLVRSYEHSATLLSVISKHVDVVYAGNTRMSMKGTERDGGQVMWSVMTMIASSERNLIVQRLTAGVVSKYRRGEWIKGKGATPVGYSLDPATRNLVLDQSATPVLTKIFEMMANPNMPNWQIAQRAGALGVTTKSAIDQYGEGATVADYRYNNSFVLNIKSWSHLYLTGVHTTRWPNPFLGAPHIAGMPVHPTPGNPHGPGELRFLYEWGRPDIDPVLIRAGLDARRARSDAPITGGAARASVAPLNGLRWIQDDCEYWVMSSSKTKYFLRARNTGEGQL